MYKLLKAPYDWLVNLLNEVKSFFNTVGGFFENVVGGIGRFFEDDGKLFQVFFLKWVVSFELWEVFKRLGIFLWKIIKNVGIILGWFILVVLKKFIMFQWMMIRFTILLVKSYYYKPIRDAIRNARRGGSKSIKFKSGGDLFLDDIEGTSNPLPDEVEDMNENDIKGSEEADDAMNATILV